MHPFNRGKVKSVLKIIIEKTRDERNNYSEKDVYKNTLDMFSCVIDAATQNITIEEWFKQEKMRSLQKSLQNDIGNMHQKILGTLDEVRDLGMGDVIDLESKGKKFIAEVKNKHNTTKGNHKVKIYDDLNIVLNKYANNGYKGFTAYYVEILPKNGCRYNECFTPSDNTIKDKNNKNRPINEKIRRIDGYSFYHLVTGVNNALEILYENLPILLSEIFSEIDFNSDFDYKSIKNSEEFIHIFNKTFVT